MLMQNEQVVDDPPMALDEYIRSEWYAERRREVVNGKLIPMPEAPDFHNTATLALASALKPGWRGGNKHLYVFDVKVNVTGTRNFYYPDLFITAEESTDANAYFKSYPLLIVEVLTDASFAAKTVYKYVAYTGIPSLLYYLIVDPQTPYIILHAKAASGEWETSTYKKAEEVIPLPLLKLSLPLSEVYE